MNKNRLTIAAAGSGKTTYLVAQALNQPTFEKVLITTYTEANRDEIVQKIQNIKGCTPANITVQTWFSFLIQHGVRPFQGSLQDELFEQNINGMLLVNTRSGKRCEGRYGPVYFGENSHFDKHYFTKSQKLFSDKLSKFVVKCDKSTSGEVLGRISNIFQHIYIDEVQDLAGYDLELLKLFFKTESSVFLVGDPRQVTYLTHNEAMNGKYKDGNIKLYLEEKCKSLIKEGIDETTLNVSHRNPSSICLYSSLLYPNYPAVGTCACEKCRANVSGHEGVFLIKPDQLGVYLDKYNPIQLKWNSKISINVDFDSMNFGESKGRAFDHVLIYPTQDMIKWISDNTTDLKNGARAKFYVALTRAKHSVAIVFNYSDQLEVEGVTKYCLEE